MKIILSLVLLVFSVAVSLADSVTLIWDQNPETDLVGYRVYWGTETGKYDETLEVDFPGVTAKIDDLDFRATGGYYFIVTAVNTIGLESPPSNELVLVVPSQVLGLKGTIDFGAVINFSIK